MKNICCTRQLSGQIVVTAVTSDSTMYWYIREDCNQFVTISFAFSKFTQQTRPESAQTSKRTKRYRPTILTLITDYVTWMHNINIFLKFSIGLPCTLTRNRGLKIKMIKRLVYIGQTIKAYYLFLYLPSEFIEAEVSAHGFVCVFDLK